MYLWPSVISIAVVVVGQTTTPPPDFLTFYNGCKEKTKNCMGVGSSDCLMKSDCDLIATFQKGTQDDIYFQLASRPALQNPVNRYIAIGISDDGEMGNDTVVSCLQFGSKMSVVLSFNTPDKLNTIVLPTEDADQLRGSFINVQGDAARGGLTRLVCNFTIPLRLVTNNVEFDMAVAKFIILLAEGKSITLKSIGYHLVQGSYDTGEPLNVTVPTFQKVVELGPTKQRIRMNLAFHVFIMPFSFLCVLPTGILIARFLKESHLDKRIFQKRIWLSIHAGSHALAYLAALLSFITLIIHMKFLPRNEELPRSHYQIGITCLVIYFLNIGTGLFHGFVEGYYATKLVTGIIHWALGAITYALATAQIFLVPYLVPSHLDKCTTPSLIVLVWVLLFLIVYVILTIVKFIGDTKTTKALEKIPSTTFPTSATTMTESQSVDPADDEDTNNANNMTVEKQGEQNTKTKDVGSKSSSKKSSKKSGSKSSSKKKKKSKKDKNKVKPAQKTVSIQEPPKKAESSLVNKLLQEEYLDQQEKPVRVVPMNAKAKEFDVKFENFPDFDETALFHDFQLDPATDADDDLWTVSRSRRRRNRFRVFYQFPLKLFSVKENPQTISFDIVIGVFFIISFALSIAFFVEAYPEKLGGKCSVDLGQKSQWFAE